MGQPLKPLRYKVAEEDFPRSVIELLAYLAPAGAGKGILAYPGAGTNVPVWLLGSTTYSAQLAAAAPLDFHSHFASHFARRSSDGGPNRGLPYLLVLDPQEVISEKPYPSWWERHW